MNEDNKPYYLRRVASTPILTVFVENEPDDEPYEDDVIVGNKRGTYCDHRFSEKKPTPIAFPEEEFMVPFHNGYFSCLPYNKSALESALKNHSEEITSFLEDGKQKDTEEREH